MRSAKLLLALGLAALAILIALMLGGRDGSASEPESVREVGSTEASELESSGKIGLAVPDGSAPDARVVVPVKEERVRKAKDGSPFGRLVVHVTWSDGAPAVEVWTKVVTWGAADPFRARSSEITDGTGTFVVEDVPPGSVSLYGALGGGGGAEIKAGEESFADLEIPDGVDVEGRVVDSEGADVPNARVWLSDGGNRKNGTYVGTSGPNGRFFLRDVSGGRHVAADAPVYAPSFEVPVPGRPGETAAITLVLPARGGALAGLVLGPGGVAVAGARLLVGNEQPRWITLPSGGKGYTSPPRSLLTNATGRFVVEGLAVGPTPVMVRTDELAPWSGSVVIEEGRRSELTIDLELGASVAGIVTQQEGSPVHKVFVGVGGYGRFLSSQVRTKTDGSYRLSGLAPGEIKIRASSDEHGKISATLQAQPGEEVRWDPMLNTGGIVGGVVTDEEGVPLVGWTVRAVEPGNARKRHSSTRTGQEGRFELVNCPPEEFDIEVREPDVLVGRAAVTLSEFEVGNVDLVIVVPASAFATCLVEGLVVDPAGESVSGASLYAFPEPGGGPSTGSPMQKPDATASGLCFRAST